jgi:hypothetical protein
MKGFPSKKFIVRSTMELNSSCFQLAQWATNFRFLTAAELIPPTNSNNNQKWKSQFVPGNRTDSLMRAVKQLQNQVSLIEELLLERMGGGSSNQHSHHKMRSKSRQTTKSVQSSPSSPSSSSAATTTEVSNRLLMVIDRRRPLIFGDSCSRRFLLPCTDHRSHIFFLHAQIQRLVIAVVTS